ncbi:hypothetical protein BC828DRAFT_383526 [Blastocladiella britannica]|nr:hypothetical protein BC828DRAFT_383526 [Blastocladiella britannica]
MQLMYLWDQLARPRPNQTKRNQRKREHSAIASCAPTRTCAPSQGQPTARATHICLERQSQSTTRRAKAHRT